MIRCGVVEGMSGLSGVELLKGCQDDPVWRCGGDMT